MSAVRNKTTSIKRPENRAAADGGRSHLGDFTRGIPVEQTISRRPQLAMFAGLFVLFVVIVAMLAIFILPINTWREQDQDLQERQEQLQQFEALNGELDAEAQRLATDAGITEAANEEMNYVEPGERQITVISDVTLPRNLPDGWPYRVSEQILAIRRAEPVAGASD
jgi:cell division protein FtsB